MPSSVETFSVTKFLPGELTITFASAIFTRTPSAQLKISSAARLSCWGPKLNSRASRRFCAEESRRLFVKKERRIRMPLQNGGRSQGADWALAAGPYSLGFPRLRDNSQNLASFQDLADRHTDRPPGNVRNLPKPALADLLSTAGFIELDNHEWLLGLEIRGRIVERQMPVFADANERNVRLSPSQLFACTANHLVGLALAVEQVIVPYAHFVDQPVKKVSAEARRMRRREADIFVQMKHLDVLPGNFGHCRERVEKFELRRSRCHDDAGAAEFLDRPS